MQDSEAKYSRSTTLWVVLKTLLLMGRLTIFFAYYTIWGRPMVSEAKQNQIIHFITSIISPYAIISALLDFYRLQAYNTQGDFAVSATKRVPWPGMELCIQFTNAQSSVRRWTAQAYETGGKPDGRHTGQMSAATTHSHLYRHSGMSPEKFSPARNDEQSSRAPSNAAKWCGGAGAAAISW